MQGLAASTFESANHADDSQAVSRYCLRCHHNLRGLCGEALRCPECGRGFDAADSKTYSNCPFGEYWAALAQNTRILIYLTAACTILEFFMLAFGIEPMWQVMLVLAPMIVAIVLVPVQILLIWIVQVARGWDILSRKWMIAGLLLIVLFINMVLTLWPLRMNFLLHKPWLDRAADFYTSQAPPTARSCARVSGKQWIGLLRIRQISVLDNGNVGFQLSGHDGGGTFLVRTAPGGENKLWYNCGSRQFAENWHAVFED